MTDLALILTRQSPLVLRAPTVVVVAAQVQHRDSIPAIEQVIAAGIAAYNILLAARALGLGGMWRTGANAYDPNVRRALGFDDETSIVGFLYLGTPDTMPRARRTAEVERYVRRWPPSDSP